MNTAYLFKQIRSGILFLLLSSVLFGLIYPGIITLVLQYLCPYKANGSIVLHQNKPIGSELIGQSFNSPKYFWGRPSATYPLPYDPAVSSGSNLSPANPTLLLQINQRINILKAVSFANKDMRIPVDLITASASGLDPHISVASARYQLQRVADIRKLDPNQINILLEKMIIPRKFGFIGEPCVNVLMLNLALDREFETQSKILR